jgi:hypothetical protein
MPIKKRRQTKSAHTSADPDLIAAIDSIKPERLLALYRGAKKGAYPFFKDPYAMIYLRKRIDKGT